MTVAIFPVKGQPPHIGRVLTLSRIYDDYEKIIIHVVAGPGKHFREEDFILPPEEVAQVFREVFRHMPKIEVILRKEHLRDRTSFDDLPHFDIIVTGNKKFVENMRSQRPVRFIPRSTVGGYDISGTLLREMMTPSR